LVAGEEVTAPPNPPTTVVFPLELPVARMVVVETDELVEEVVIMRIRRPSARMPQ
jgi:hypothetical protein